MSTGIAAMPVKCQRIHAPKLDPIVAVWINDQPGKGQVILQCFNQAWTASWGAMGTESVEDFFVSCDVQYLTGSFVQGTRRTKADEAYLARIVAAVRDALIGQRVTA